MKFCKIIYYPDENNISIIQYFIDLYLECISVLRTKNPIKDTLKKKFRQ